MDQVLDGEEWQGIGAEPIASALADAVLLAGGSLPDVSEIACMTEADTRPRRRGELPRLTRIAARG